MSERLRTTGRAPSVNFNTLRKILVRYFEEDQPTVSEISAEFKLCEATTRKYLRMVLGPLPRGKAALLPREARSVQALLNSVTTTELLGPGRLELLARRRNDGAGVVALAQEFGISRQRAKAVIAEFEG